MPAFDSFTSTVEKLRERLDDVMKQVKRARQEFRTAFDQARANVEANAVRMGLPAKDENVIDMGPAPSMLTQVGKAVVLVVASGVATSVLFTFGIISLQLFCLFLLLTRGLGIRIDLNAMNATPAAA
jgi:hypothetical protein